MRILLVRPPVPKYTVGLKHIMICEPLELEYVAAGLDGHEVAIMDLILEHGLKRRLNRFKPDIVGTSCYINGVNEVKKICRAVKRWNPECRTIVGGVHASRNPEDFEDESVDCVVMGDGTSVISEIVAAFENGRSLDEISGLAIPIGDGRLRRTMPLQQYMPDPNSLPFPRRDLVAHLRHRYYYLFHQPVTTMKTTWGCWYKCNFCFTWKITDGVAYARSAESIADELEQIDTEEVYIVDDIFLINRTRLNRLAALIRERNIRKKYLIYARADFISENEDLVKEWAGLGLSAVIVGLEAATDVELESMRKECTVNYNVQAIKTLRRHCIDTYGSLIPHPDYTQSDWDRLQAFIDDNDLYYLNISPLTPMPGTDIWDQYKDQVVVPRSAHGLWDLSHSVLPTRVPLKNFYRALLRVYARSILDIRRANRLALRTRPPVWSLKYLRLWAGAVKIMFQFLRLHRHHESRVLKQAMDSGRQSHAQDRFSTNGVPRQSPHKSR